jgi:hypothetical protein
LPTVLPSTPKASIFYVANSLLWYVGGCAIHRITLPGGDAKASETWYRPFPLFMLLSPNGLKVWGDRVYYTCMRAPIPTASLESVPVGDPRYHDVVYAQPCPLGAMTGFDDFDVVENGFVIANFIDWSLGNDATGALRFVDGSGTLMGTFRHPDLLNPSAVKVVPADCTAFLPWQLCSRREADADQASSRVRHGVRGTEASLLFLTELVFKGSSA